MKTSRVVVCLGTLATLLVASATRAQSPAIASLSPSSGPIGTTVTITGSNFSSTSSLLSGKIGTWGPFASGVAPNNQMAGKPNGRFVGSPRFTGDGGGSITSDDYDYLAVADGGAYDWTSGAWSVQVDFTFPYSPSWPSGGVFLLASKGSYTKGNGWEIEINNITYQGKYQIELESNHGVNNYSLITAYQITPGSFHRALVTCDGNGHGVWYVNGTAWNTQSCAAPWSGTTDLVIGRHSEWSGLAANFPITRVQIWNRALSSSEAVASTTSDPSSSSGTVTINGTPVTTTSWTSTGIVATVPAGATSGPVVVTVGGRASNGVPFSVVSPVIPSITSLSTSSGLPGAAVTITGTNFGATQSGSVLTFNGLAATPSSWSATQIVASVPATASSGPVVVTAGGRASNGVAFTVVVPPPAAPIITSVSPSSGRGETVVTITGTNFGTPGLLAGKIGAWGPFASGAAPNNLVTGAPNGRFIGTPKFTSDGGGAITSDDADYLTIADGGAGGTYDWTTGPWSVQVDFAFPLTPIWPAVGSFVLASKGSYGAGSGWEMTINNYMYQGKYQLQLTSTRGGSYVIVRSYLVAPGALHRALFTCDGNGNGIWYVNGAAWSTQPCAPTASAATNLVIGRHSQWTGAAAGFPISRVQVWNRSLTTAEAMTSTTSDPAAAAGVVTFNGTAAIPTFWSTISIVVPVPAGATTGSVVVKVGGQSSNGVTFQVTP